MKKEPNQTPEPTGPERPWLILNVRLKDCATLMNLKNKTLLDRIERLEEEIAKGREYLESGKHADWHGFRPLFASKVRDGKALPPHEDWVKNVFLPNHEKSLRKAHELLERLAIAKKKKANQPPEPTSGLRPAAAHL